MCGICGSVGRADGTLIEQMTRTLVHRGPDGEGTKVFPTVSGSVPAALGHRRLSIIDTTERGAQPMPYAGDRYWITFNGEIYNYRELRGELEELGFSFKTETDTEVLLASFVAHGPGMLDRINGIFAFGIWDREESSLFLARDRLGVKPLYWARRDEELHFAFPRRGCATGDACRPSPGGGRTRSRGSSDIGRPTRMDRVLLPPFDSAATSR